MPVLWLCGEPARERLGHLQHRLRAYPLRSRLKGLVMTRQSLRARIRSVRTAFSALVQYLPHAAISEEEFAAHSRLCNDEATATDLRMLETCVVREMNPARRAG